MKLSLAVLVLAATAYANSEADASRPTRPDRKIEEFVPECAIPCINNFVVNHTKCKLTDYKCICKHKDVEDKDAVSCVIDQCGFARAKNQVLHSVHDFCKVAGRRRSN